MNYLLAKRALDIVGSAIGLVALSPVLATLWVCVRVRFGSPAIFRQERPGRGGYPFTLLKFRTMTDARAASGELLPDGERLTSLGRFVRRWSLDELPELFNVLRGDMSLVGPRPLLMRYLERYSPFEMRRHEVKPGVTGWAQVNGRNATTWDERFALDVWYADHLSFWLDVRILAITAWRVAARQGISQPGQATMEEFRGGSGQTN